MWRRSAAARRLGVLLAGAVALSLSGGCGGKEASPAAETTAEVPRPQVYGHGDLPAAAQRVVEIRMGDDLRFGPAQVPVRKGEVITFRLVNTDRQFHEFTIGGPAAQDLHDAQMASMDMSGTGSGMAMSGDHSGMKMPNDPAHKRYMKELARRIAVLDKEAAANDSVHVPPGETRELTWAFTTEKTPQFGCHVVGHWAGGMRGSFQLVG